MTSLPVGDSDTYTETVAPPTDDNPSPQYSPSISHDEVECEGSGGSGTGLKVNGHESFNMDDKKVGVKWEEEGEEEEEGWGETWSDIEEPREHEKQVSASDHEAQVTVVGNYENNSGAQEVSRKSSSGSKLFLKKSSKNSQEEGEKEEGERNSLKGRLNSEDILRLEEQSIRAMGELDLFADMSPNITTSGSLQSPLGLGGGSDNKGDLVNSSKTALSRVPNALHYRPEQEVR